MEDKIIIKSERYNVKKIFKYALIIGLGIFLFLFLFFGIECIKFYSIREYFEPAEGFYDIEHICISLFGAVATFPAEIIYALIPLIISSIIYVWMKSYELNITEKRAYGFAAFGKRVDLPVDSITAIGLGWLKSITITTASGKISFLLIKNRDEMYETISKLIVERQNREAKSETVVKQEIPQSNADELKKYKDLLDSGVITQEEFDQKKKQLLGL